MVAIASAVLQVGGLIKGSQKTVFEIERALRSGVGFLRQTVANQAVQFSGNGVAVARNQGWRRIDDNLLDQRLQIVGTEGKVSEKTW